MRTEKEMMDLILNIAKTEDRIRAVYMNGSRTNPNVQKDMYQDYDIVYVVTETESFIADKNWILNFGNPLIVQEPDRNDMQTGFNNKVFDFSRRYVWLMLFEDGNRIDLAIEVKEEAVKNFLEDKLTVLLVDKDNLLPGIPLPTDIDYHIKRPTENAFAACCNEFWWCLNNVAKGIAREEVPYAMEMLNKYVREMLNHMVEWYIGINTHFSVSAGKMGKYYKNYLPKELYGKYCETYSRGTSEDIWEAVFSMCGLFHILALPVAEQFGFIYRQSEEDGIRKYLKEVRAHCTK